VRILTFTNLYPNGQMPNCGIFIKNRMLAFARKYDAQLDVVAPIPFFPKLPIETKWQKFSRIEFHEEQDGVHVYHPRYFVFPKLGMALHANFIFYSCYRLIKKLHLENKYDLIDAHWVYPDGSAAVKIGQKLGLPVVLSARGSDINEYQEIKGIRKLIFETLDHCQTIIAVSEALKKVIMQGDIPAAKIHAIGNGVDLMNFRLTPRLEARKMNNIRPDDKVIVSVGRLVPLKGHHILIEAVKILVNRGFANIKLLIIGSGEYETELQQLVAKHSLGKHVMLVGEIPYKQLACWFNAAHLMCLASKSEGWPNVVLESMACGTPVVATNVAGIPEIICSENYGFLVDKREATSFANAIEKALAKDWNREEIAGYARQFTWETVAEKVHKVFREVVHQNAYSLSP